MKPRNTRIKVVEKFDGHRRWTVYIPQHQNFFGFWYDFSDHDGYSIVSHTNPYTYATGGDSLSCAQEQIDSYIKAFEKNEIRRKGKDIISVEYIKYP